MIFIADSQKQTESYAAQTQELFEKLAVEDRSAKQREPSVDLMTSPALDVERERLNEISEELEDDRRKFTEAALKLGKEKAALEASFCFVFRLREQSDQVLRPKELNFWRRRGCGKLMSCSRTYHRHRTLYQNLPRLMHLWSQYLRSNNRDLLVDLRLARHIPRGKLLLWAMEKGEQCAAVKERYCP